MSAVPEFMPNLLHDARSSGPASSAELRRANALLASARIPVEVPRARQGNLPELAKARESIRAAMRSPFSLLANAVFEACRDVASCVDLHQLFRDTRRAGGRMLDQFPRIDGDDRRTQVTLFMLDPFDDCMLRSEPDNVSAALGRGIVGHVAKTGRVLNLAIAEMSDHPTNNLNPNKPDNAVDPDEFWMSFQGDPTKDVLCVPVYETKAEFEAAQVEAEALKARQEEELARQTPQEKTHASVSCTWTERQTSLKKKEQPGSATVNVGSMFALTSATGKVTTVRRRIVGVLHAERPSIRAHFRQQRSRQGKRRGGHRSRGGSRGGSRGSSRGSNSTNNDIDSPSAKERAQKAPFSPGLEEAFCQLAHVVSAAIHQANNDAGNGFADQARRFREKKNMTRVFKTFERIARAAQNRRVAASLEESQGLRTRVTLMSTALDEAAETATEQRKRLAEALEAKEEAELAQQRCQKELDLLIAKTRGLQSDLSQCKAGALQGERRLQQMKTRLKDHHNPADLKEIEMLKTQVRALTGNLRDAAEEAQQQKIRRVLGRLAMRGQAMAFHAWHHTVEEQRAQKTRMRRLMARMLNRLLGTTFDAWVFFLEEEKRMRALLARAAAKMMMRIVSQAWNSFLEYVELRRWLREFCTKMIRRFEQKEMAMGFGKWKSEFLEARRQEEWDAMTDEQKRRSRFCAVQ